MTPDTAAAGRPAAMRFIMLVVLIDMLAVGLIVPVLPALVGKFTASPSEQTYWYGVVAFTFGFATTFVLAFTLEVATLVPLFIVLPLAFAFGCAFAVTNFNSPETTLSPFCARYQW